MRSGTVGALAIAVLLAITAEAQAASRSTAPHISDGHAVAGAAHVGGRVRSTARWSGSKPIDATYEWLRCTDTAVEHCAAIAGATSRRYTVQPADAGAYLRSKVTVANERGWAWVLSLPTAEIAEAAAEREPVPEPGSAGGVLSESAEQPAFLAPFPVVRIRGRVTPSGVRVSLLTVRAPRGARVAIRCAGPSCPRRGWARSATLVHLKPYEVALRPGVRLTITITRPGFVGKHTRITVRRGMAPTRRDRCLYPNERDPRACPGH
jgi:hypothetical protein